MPTPAEAASQRLSWEMDSWKSLDIHSDQKISDLVVSDPKKGSYQGHMLERYVETATGERLYENKVVADDGQETLDANYADGSRFADATFRGPHARKMEQVILKSSFADEGRSGTNRRPDPLRYLYVGQTPLPKALLSGGVVHLKSDRHLGRECDVFLIPQARWTAHTPLDLVYTLDRETGFPLKLSLYFTPEDREQDRAISTWSADSFDEIKGHHLPLRSTEVIYDRSPDGPPIKRAVRKLTITEADFDRDYPTSTFWPVIQPGVMVWDKVANKHWHQPNADGTPFVQAPAATRVAQPIKATPPRDWSTPASYAGLTLGAAVLVVAFLLWRRGR